MSEGVIVNGILKKIPYRRCVRCISDTTCPGITFDNNGVCNFCHLHDKWCRMYPNDERGQQIWNNTLKKIKRDGRGKKYDCIVGISGGRDSSYVLHLAVTKYQLRPLAVHFNDGFDNPVAGENMVNITRKLGVDLRTITSDWREAKDLKISFLKASVPDLNQGTDVGIAAACYGVACKEGLKHIIYGQSFRTEGIKPISWAYMVGDYLNDVQNKFGTVKLRPWKPEDPNYHFGWKQLFYYSFIKGIRAYSPLYYEKYIRREAEEILKREYNWVYPGAHYYDDLYWSLITYVHRVKFNIDFRLNAYSALIRDGQMDRDWALEAVKKPYVMEDPRIIDLCLKRLAVSREDFEAWLRLPPKTFRDYNTGYSLMWRLRPLIKLISKLGFFPEIVYDKYFLCGE
ncbi:MAG: N-acetyl sugar amidotransferase [Chitinophagales bacterium]|nr:N-acetyl sugar amidotransferase [Chitinophagales bacterium]MDW8417816.1 N-acetyl sugar amidotransferase [Chitinophagales bacterium]